MKLPKPHRHRFFYYSKNRTFVAQCKKCRKITHRPWWPLWVQK